MPRGIYARRQRHGSIPRALAADVVSTTIEASAPTKQGTKPVETLSAKVQRMITGLRHPFTDFVIGFGDITKTRAQLAPQFIKAFKAWQDETEGSFIGFVRVFDPSVPEDRKRYRHNMTYQAALYLQRLTVVRKVMKKRGPKRATPFQAIATLAATILPLVQNADMLWAAFLKELHWTAPQVKRVQSMVEKTKPLLVKSGQERKLHAA